VATIHPTAIVDPEAVLADGCRIGPFSTVGPHVTVGEGTEVGQGCHLTGHVTIGKGNAFYPYCCIGTPPQDLSYDGEELAVEIGDENIFREFCTVNMGTAKDRRLTSIGSHNYFMAYVHVGHDSDLGDHVLLINGVGLSGHTCVEDHAVVCGLSGAHQFVTVGKYAFVGAMSGLAQDAPPYMTSAGSPARVQRVNVVGLQRHGFPAESIDQLKRAHRIFYRSKLTRVEAFKILESRDDGLTPEVRYLIDFLRRQMKGRQGRQREARKAGRTG